MSITKNLLAAGSVLVIGAGLGYTFSTSAEIENSTNTTSGSNSVVAENTRMGRGRKAFNNLTDEQKATLKANREAVVSALESKDYNAWREAIAKLPNGGDRVSAKIDSEEKFLKLSQAHSLRKEAREIMQELGVEENMDKPAMESQSKQI